MLLRPEKVRRRRGSGGAAHGGPSALVQDLVTGRGDLQWPSHARASGRDGKARRWRPEGGSSRLLRARRSGARWRRWWHTRKHAREHRAVGTRRRQARPAGQGRRASRRGAERGRASEGERWGVGSSASSSIPRRGGRARGRGGRARGKEAWQWWPRPRTRGVLEAFYRARGERQYDRRGEPIWAASGLNQTLGQKLSLFTSACSTFFIKALQSFEQHNSG